MGGRGSGHGIKRADHTFGTRPDGIWGPPTPRGPRVKGRHHMKSLFSDKLDPSLHRDRLKRLNLSAEEQQMRLVQKKAFQAEARDLQNLAKQFSLKGMETCVAILDNPDSSDAAKLQAINMIWDRAYGKASMTTFNVNANIDANPKELDGADLDKRIAEAINNVEKKIAETNDEGDERPINIREYN